MGPYYRGTSQGVGGFFTMLYEHPFTMLFIAACVVAAGVYFWRRSKAGH